MTPEKRDGRAYSPWIKDIVGIEKSKDFTACARKSLIQAIGWTVIRFKDRMRNLRTIAPYQFPASVARAGIDHNVFEIAIALRQHGIDRLLQVGSLIERKCDDSDLHSNAKLDFTRRMNSHAIQRVCERYIKDGVTVRAKAKAPF